MDAGRKPGVDLGDDMNPLNIVAALEVSGDGTKVAREDLFGATYRQNNTVSILPTDPRCEEEFQFDAQGNVIPLTDDGRETIEQLNMNHGTLIGWRMQAISTFVEIIQSRADAQNVIDRTSNPTNGILPEYAFAIRSVAQSMLEISEA